MKRLLFVALSLTFICTEKSYAQDPFIGEIKMFAGNFAPVGYAFCDGQLLPISQYTALFSILGTTYGGDGQVTFALPDLRGRVPIHQGQGPGLSSYPLGSGGGLEENVLTTGHLPSHTHTATVSPGAFLGPAEESNPSGAYPAIPTEDAYAETQNATMGSTTVTVSHTGANLAVENRQPYRCISYIIALVGLYPSQN